VNPNPEKFLLQYQIDWLKDKSPVKIWEKSRRIGATYVQALEDVQDIIKGVVDKVWFSSADESAAKEYIDYCAYWATVYQAAASAVGHEIIDPERDVKVLVITFRNGSKIHALSSNPKGFRSKGGKVVLDEFAFHDNAMAMWKAAKPVTTWGYPLRILSTHHGKGCLYYKFLESCKKGLLKWSLHKTDIFDAVDDGLVDKIYRRPTIQAEREEWIQQVRADCFDETTFQEEYCCVAVDEATAFLTYDQIYSIEDPDVLIGLGDIDGDLYVGVDIGRKKDLTVIWALERIGPLKFTRRIEILKAERFAVQRDVLFKILSHPRLRRAAIDATGLGMQLAEEAQEEFGRYRIEAVTFTNRVKEEMAYNLRTDVEDKTVVIPIDPDIREDLHSIRKVTTAAGNIRFDVNSMNTDGHADRFWALALALDAARDQDGPIYIATRGQSRASQILRGYE
jgi:phage FluMu gp28-like protein